jgi:cytochrome c5
MQQRDHHVSTFKNWKQLAVIVVLAFVVPIVLGVLLSQWVTSGSKGLHDDDSAIIKRIQPVGEVLLASASGPKGQLTGEQVYGQVCKTCHDAGLAGAPKLGDKAAWAKVIAQGQALTAAHAIEGIRGMPPKGGNPDFENVEVERTVVFMAGKAGASWKEPAAKMAASAPSPASVTAAAPAPAAAGKPDGKKVYDTTCMVCHGTGVAGAPKFGDKAAWAPRMKTGIDALYATALKGKGAMPTKGGNASLPDVDVKAAVDYMAAAVK